MNIGSREATVFAKWMGALSRIGALETGKNFYDAAFYTFSVLTPYLLTGMDTFFSSNYLRKVFIFGGDQACERL